MDTQRTYRELDPLIEEDVRRVSVSDLARALYPDIRIHSGGYMSSPFREDRHPSFSCFSDDRGRARWKDHATGESGNVIDFMMKAEPSLSFPDAVDRIAWLCLGRSAYVEPTAPVKAVTKSGVKVSSSRVPSSPKAKKSALEVVSVVPLSDGSVPDTFRDYWRRRGISDEVAGKVCSYVTYENLNRKGLPLYDSKSGLPIVDADGTPLLSNGRRDALGLPNDIGGFSLRSPSEGKRPGFKGGTSSFISTIFQGGTFASVSENSRFGRFAYVGSDSISKCTPFYDGVNFVLYLSRDARFTGVAPGVAAVVMPFVSDWTDRPVMKRDILGIGSVIRSVSTLQSGQVRVVEGMFDALSVMEYDRLNYGGFYPVSDIVVLNSVSNIRWAVPFLSVHETVVSMLDNDLRSGAGQKAAEQLFTSVAEYSKRAYGNRAPQFYSATASFGSLKDMNEFLMKKKGFELK